MHYLRNAWNRLRENSRCVWVFGIEHDHVPEAFRALHNPGSRQNSSEGEKSGDHPNPGGSHRSIISGFSQNNNLVPPAIKTAFPLGAVPVRAVSEYAAAGYRGQRLSEALPVLAVEQRPRSKG